MFPHPKAEGVSGWRFDEVSF